MRINNILIPVYGSFTLRLLSAVVGCYYGWRGMRGMAPLEPLRRCLCSPNAFCHFHNFSPHFKVLVEFLQLNQRSMEIFAAQILIRAAKKPAMKIKFSNKRAKIRHHLWMQLIMPLSMRPLSRSLSSTEPCQESKKKTSRWTLFFIMKNNYGLRCDANYSNIDFSPAMPRCAAFHCVFSWL